MKAVVWRGFKFEGTSKVEVPVPLNNQEENCNIVETMEAVIVILAPGAKTWLHHCTHTHTHTHVH